MPSSGSKHEALPYLLPLKVPRQKRCWLLPSHCHHSELHLVSLCTSGQLNVMWYCLRNPKGRSEAKSVWTLLAKCAWTKRNTFILEGKQLSLVFLVLIRGSPGEVKASTCFLSWHFYCGSNPLPGALHQNLSAASSAECIHQGLL